MSHTHRFFSKQALGKHLVCALSVLIFAPAAWALGENAGDLPVSQTQAKQAQAMMGGRSQADQAISQRALNRQTGNYGTPKTAQTSEAIQVFGQQIFEGGFSGARSDGLNPDYTIAPGDRVILRAWGAMEMDSVLPVDAQGNIFIPTIGPVPVQGVNHAQLDSQVRSAIKNIYPNNVEVYTQLQGVQPVSVFVTGFVNKPGRYAGVPKDSLLYFLNQAQGVDPEKGSYRKITVQRDGVTIAQADLYQFLTDGTQPTLQFQEGDTIVVARRGATVEKVLPDQESTLLYELAQPIESGKAFLGYDSIKADVSHVLVQGTRNQKPFFKYLTLSEFQGFQLQRGDTLTFKADQRSDSILVQIEGSFLGQSQFILPKNAKLKELLNNIPVQPQLTATDAVSIRRLSIAQKQKEALDASLRRLENTYLTATSATAEEASIRIKEAELIQNFVQRANQVQPNGRLVVATKQGVQDVRLQDGDVITLPTVAESVLTSGQVLVPRSIVYQPGLSLEDYIQKSGGFTDQADPDKIVVIRQSGEVLADADAMVQPGDEILVLPEVPTKNIQLATSISQILYQIAIAAKVAFDL